MSRGWRLTYYIDDPETFDGMPVAVQVVGRTLEEEKVLSIAEEMIRCLQFNRDGDCTDDR